MEFEGICRELGPEAEMEFEDIAPLPHEPGPWLYTMALEDAKNKKRQEADMIENRYRMYDDILMHVSTGSEMKIR